MQDQQALRPAFFLAKKGVKSTLIDKAVFPRHKPCGDNISGNTIRVLNELDPNFIKNLQLEKKSLEMKGVVAYAANNHKMKIDFLTLEPDTKDPSCYTIPRVRLDNELINKAKANPLIEVIEGFSVTNLTRQENGILIESKKQSIFTNLAIVCSGSNANFVKNLHKVEKKTNMSPLALEGIIRMSSRPYMDNIVNYTLRKIYCRADCMLLILQMIPLTSMLLSEVMSLKRKN